MVVSGAGQSLPRSSATDDRFQELMAFDESKAGVKGLVDSDITKVPRIFLRPPEDLAGDHPVFNKPSQTQFKIPLIDLKDIAGDRAGVIAGVRHAATTVGFFQVVNHGIPMKVLEEMVAAVREFHELPREVKAEYYTRAMTKKVKYGSNFDLYQSKFANWRDTLSCSTGPEPLEPQERPMVCRDIIMEYSRQVQVLGKLLFELLSEGLGLNPHYLESIDCAKGRLLLNHYYPTCPEPELTMGATRHTDPGFLTVLLQDHIGGLQVLWQNEWIDVPHISGAQIVNIGDMLQLISNDTKVWSTEFWQAIKALEYQLHTSSFLIATHQQECMAPSRNYYQKITPRCIEKHHRKNSMLTFIARDLMGIQLLSILCHSDKYVTIMHLSEIS